MEYKDPWIEEKERMLWPPNFLGFENQQSKSLYTVALYTSKKPLTQNCKKMCESGHNVSNNAYLNPQAMVYYQNQNHI